MLPLRIAFLLAILACSTSDDTLEDSAASAPPASAAAPAPPPEEGPLPVMLNDPPPFHYPALLYAERVQANVTLRLYVDSLGGAVPESTRVEETSNYPALDSAAIAGSRELRFSPARRDGRRVGASVLFPVYFRHPDAAPLPGDSAMPSAAPATQPTP